MGGGGCIRCAWQYACAVAYDSNSNGDEEIVVLGGKAENYVFLKSVEAFDIETRTWSPMPVRCTELLVAAISCRRWLTERYIFDTGHECRTLGARLCGVGGEDLRCGWKAARSGISEHG